MRAYLKRHPLSVYFGIAFLISWGGGLLVEGPRLLRGQPIGPAQTLALFPVLVVGVGLAGLALTALVDGRAGVRDLLARMGRWRVGAGWWAAALFTAPVLILLTLLALRNFVSPAFASGFFPLGLVFGLVPGLFEEVGWTGFAYPRLIQRRSPLAAAVMLGVLWGLWHLPVVDYLGAAAPHGGYWLAFFGAFVLLVAAMRVLIEWVYLNTRSLLLAQLMHASSTACLVLFGAPGVSAGQEALWYAIYGLVLWVCVALVVRAEGPSLARLPAAPRGSAAASRRSSPQQP
jgi:membrane protease YdiL (CAAX protease family)